MMPTETLRHEHEVILLVLQGAGREGKAAQQSGRCDLGRVEKMVDFFQMFVDRCHHSKEERFLFPAMRKRGIAVAGGPLGVMLREHDSGREHVKAIACALEGTKEGRLECAAPLGENLVGYAALLREHIGKENDVLFPLADKVLTAEDQIKLTTSFDKVESEEMGESVHEKYRQLAHELAEEPRKAAARRPSARKPGKRQRPSA
jgi:hemerythrin-like domain-containing protein